MTATPGPPSAKPPGALPDAAARGRGGEALAALWLEMQGCVVLGRSVRCADVEVDLVARDAAHLLLVEVKLRRDGPQRAIEALHPAQWARLRRAAAVLLVRHPWAESVRMDLVAIDWTRGELRMRHVRGVAPR